MCIFLIFLPKSCVSVCVFAAYLLQVNWVQWQLKPIYHQPTEGHQIINKIYIIVRNERVVTKSKAMLWMAKREHRSALTSTAAIPYSNKFPPNVVSSMKAWIIGVLLLFDILCFARNSGELLFICIQLFYVDYLFLSSCCCCCCCSFFLSSSVLVPRRFRVYRRANMKDVCIHFNEMAEWWN